MVSFEKFADRVEKIPFHACWEWTGSLTDNGYGRVYSYRRRGRGPEVSVVAHRLSWEFYRGAIPEGSCVLHHCDNKTCVNPDHLFLGTRTDNALDRDKKGRQRTGNRRLTPEDRVQIGAMLANGMKQREVAARYQTTQGHISRIKAFLEGKRRWASG